MEPTGVSLFYEQWLGISREECPPNHYRLLGLRIFEPNMAVIMEAANRQMAVVKQHENTRYDAVQQLLYAMALARLCLLNKGTKAEYDEHLGKTLMPPPPKVEPLRAEPMPVEPTSGAPSPYTFVNERPQRPFGRKRRGRNRRPSFPRDFSQRHDQVPLPSPTMQPDTPHASEEVEDMERGSPGPHFDYVRPFRRGGGRGFGKPGRSRNSGLGLVGYITSAIVGLALGAAVLHELGLL
jgi:hypothetical protein